MRHDAMFTVIIHDVSRSDEGRHITTGFTRKTVIDRPEVRPILTTRTSDGLLHVALSTVVGSNGQTPIAKHVIEVAQIMCCRLTGFDGITTFIDQGVHLQSIAFAGTNHELPQTCSTSPGGGRRTKGRLDDWEVSEFQGQAITFQCLLKDGVIEVGSPQHDGNRTLHACTISIDELACHIIERHLYRCRDARQSADQHRIIV